VWKKVVVNLDDSRSAPLSPALAEKSATVGLAGGGEIATIANNQPHTIFVQGSAQFV
jgi:hypothetical protein